MPFRLLPSPLAALLKVAQALCLILVCALLVESRPLTHFEQIQARGLLRVISVNGPETFYESADGGLDGFEYQLAKAFADELGVELEIVPAASLGDLMAQLDSNDTIDLAASGLMVTDSRRQHLDFSLPYLEVEQLLIYRNGTGKPVELPDLAGRQLLVTEDSSEAELLARLADQHPELTWAATADHSSLDLIEQVHRGDLDFTLVKSTSFAIGEPIFPRAQVGYRFEQPQQLAWAFKPRADQSLLAAANRFLAEDGQRDRIAKLHKSHLQPNVEVSTGGALLFSNRVDQRLPRWEQLLREAGQTHNLDWMLLAAIAYQESHWNPRAKSPTGVRGMMMLTRNTAEELGVEDRLDPGQSIDGGARYLIKLFERLPKTVVGEDRMWLTLAAYNVGYGHLMDARKLARKLNKNPNDWDQLAEVLPLLAQRKYYREARHGYARGWEPVQYVNNIRRFHTLLAWHKQVEKRRLAMADNPILAVDTQGSASHPVSSL